MDSGGDTGNSSDDHDKELEELLLPTVPYINNGFILQHVLDNSITAGWEAWLAGSEACLTGSEACLADSEA